MIVSRSLSELIKEKLDVASEVFRKSQAHAQVPCPTGCGKCCLYPDIHCSPIELIPLAYDLYDRGMADLILNKIEESSSKQCQLFQLVDEKLGKGFCGHYEYRPYICRAFGVFGRRGKHGEIEVSACHLLSPLLNVEHLDKNKIGLIDVEKVQVFSTIPHSLEKEVPINQAIKLALEAVLFKESFSE